jgi:hypothetical protein
LKYVLDIYLYIYKEAQIFLGKLKIDWSKGAFLIFKIGLALFFAKVILCGEGILSRQILA